MQRVAIATFCVFMSISVSVDFAEAQRGRNGLNPYASGRSAPVVRINPVSPHRIGAQRRYPYRGIWLPSAAVPVIVNTGEYVGNSDHCVLERREVWNGWATFRELVTVCQ